MTQEKTIKIEMGDARNGQAGDNRAYVVSVVILAAMLALIVALFAGAAKAATCEPDRTPDCEYPHPPPDGGYELPWTPPYVDPYAPMVTSTAPAADATGVSSADSIWATFSEEMESTSINTQTFKLFKKGSKKKIGAVVKYFPDNPITATFDPRATLDPNTSLQSGVTYKAVVETEARDLAYNALDQDSATSGSQPKQWVFTVRR
jgi:hypothetical protein